MKIFLLLFLFPIILGAQITCGGATAFQILHFTKTSGFDHNTRDQSNAMFTAIGTAENFTVVNSSEESVFDDLATLLTYEVIIFANTSGNIPFTATQRDNLEQYVASGGGVLGIHAATDMYRDASYPFFTKLIGGSRRNSPAHTSSGKVAMMDTIGAHPSTINLPDPWEKQEEYYYWPDSGLVANIVEVLRVRDTGNNSYNDPRPISWYQKFTSGARSFYTALGHSRNNYTDPDNDFRQHLRDALCWCVEAGKETTAESTVPTDLVTTEKAEIRYSGGKPMLFLNTQESTTAMLFDASGRMLSGLQLQPGYNQLPTPKPGMYVLRLPFRRSPSLRYVVH